MGVIGSSIPSPGILTIKPVKNPVNTTVITDPTPNTESNFTLTTIKRFRLVNRGAAIIKYAYYPGDSGTNYGTINPGGSSEEENIDDQTITIYVQSPSASQRLEVVSWS
jgi:hypothetical protein